MENLEEMCKFSNIILDKVKTQKLEYIDAIVSYCEDHELEIETVLPLISPALKMKIEEEAIGLRLLKPTTPRLIF